MATFFLGGRPFLPWANWIEAFTSINISPYDIHYYIFVRVTETTSIYHDEIALFVPMEPIDCPVAGQWTDKRTGASRTTATATTRRARSGSLPTTT